MIELASTRGGPSKSGHKEAQHEDSDREGGKALQNDDRLSPILVNIAAKVELFNGRFRALPPQSPCSRPSPWPIDLFAVYLKLETRHAFARRRHEWRREVLRVPLWKSG